MGTSQSVAVTTSTTPAHHLLLLLTNLQNNNTDTTMSWDKYISDQLLATGNVQKGAICGLDGSIWAVSDKFNVQPDEAKKLAAAFKDSSVLQMSGIFVAGDKFMFLSATEDVLRGKKGSNGVHIVKTLQAIIIGYYADPVQPGQCATTVEALGDYLKSVNY